LKTLGKKKRGGKNKRRGRKEEKEEEGALDVDVRQKHECCDHVLVGGALLTGLLCMPSVPWDDADSSLSTLLRGSPE
jgi:hypothetical protein